ncbi:NAD(P)H-dependent flavin oxidoreductase [Chloroflexota bacterium]
MKRTRVCDLFGIRYPIIQGAMGWIASAELASAVSNAGGLGTLAFTADAAADASFAEVLKTQIKKIRTLTDKPFAVNISLRRGETEEMIAVALNEKVPAVVTIAGNPKLYTGRLQDAGIKVLHVVFTEQHAVGAEEAGVDAVIAMGYEAGGRGSQWEITTMVLIPLVANVVKIPVIAAGGIGDGRGALAAFALGAEGIQMGTRFILTEECIAHRNCKEALLKASAGDTTVTGRGVDAARVLRTEFTERVLALEKSGASPEELLEFIGIRRSRMAALDGNLEEGSILSGQIAGLTKQVTTVEEVIRDITDGFDSSMAGISSLSNC